MSANGERLYGLLPEVYRLRDAAQGGQLKALLEVMEGQLSTLRDDIAGLYDNWFVETCQEWVVPYIADLLGVRSQYIFDNESTTLRPFVANTLRYRRSKGTAHMLEGLARDVTGWPAAAVEFFQLLATTQNLNHVRAVDLRTPDLRDTDALELLGGPFERAMRFAEVRRISTRSGKYDIGNVGIFLWRLLSLPLEKAPAIPAPGAGSQHFRFSQLGADLGLYNRGRSDTEARVVESDMPGPLRRRALYDELRAARAALHAGESPVYRYLDDDPALRVFADGVEVPPASIQICDLSGWTTIPKSETVTLPAPPGQPPPPPLETRVSVDPVLGRLVYVSGAVPETTHVSYHYGFSAKIGGGSYARQPGVDPPADAVTYLVDVLDPAQTTDDGFLARLDEWEAQGRPDAIFVFRGPAMFDHKGSGIFRTRDFAVPVAGRVVLRADDGSRPLIRLLEPWKVTLAENSALTLDGLLVAGERTEVETTVSGDELAHSLTIEDCTFVPGGLLDEGGSPTDPDGVSLASAAASRGLLSLSLVRSICGRIDMTAGAADFAADIALADSIVDGAGGSAPAVSTHGQAVFDRGTILGATACGSLVAGEVIFDAPVVALRTQIGCVRFSYVPAGSTTPRAYRCQPALALSEAGDDDAAVQHIGAWLRPSYTSRRYGDAAYCQLRRDCPTEISAGAEAGREMGAFRSLMQPQRLTNLATSLDEYLRFGLEAGAFLVT